MLKASQYTKRNDTKTAFPQSAWVVPYATGPWNITGTVHCILVHFSSNLEISHLVFSLVFISSYMKVSQCLFSLMFLLVLIWKLMTVFSVFVTLGCSLQYTYTYKVSHTFFSSLSRSFWKFATLNCQVNTHFTEITQTHLLAVFHAFLKVSHAFLEVSHAFLAVSHSFFRSFSRIFQHFLTCFFNVSDVFFESF